MVFGYKYKTHRFSTCAGGKHLPDTRGSAHDPRAVTQHEDQLLDVSRSKCPVLTRRQRHQFNPLHRLSCIHTKQKSSVNIWNPTSLLMLNSNNSIPSSSTWNSKPFFLKMSMLSMSVFSLTAVRWSFWGLRTWWTHTHQWHVQLGETSCQIRFLRYELLSLENRVLLQHLKVILLICGMLVDYKDVRLQFGYDESQVKLTDDLHVFKLFFAVDGDEIVSWENHNIMKELCWEHLRPTWSLFWARPQRSGFLQGWFWPWSVDSTDPPWPCVPLGPVTSSF